MIIAWRIWQSAPAVHVLDSVHPPSSHWWTAHYHDCAWGSASVHFPMLVLPPATHCLTISAPWLNLSGFVNWLLSHYFTVAFNICCLIFGILPYICNAHMFFFNNKCTINAVMTYDMIALSCSKSFHIANKPVFSLAKLVGLGMCLLAF